MNDFITLDYGSGGKKTSDLIEKTIVPMLHNEALAQLGDGAILPGSEKLAFSTDSFVISPYFFPGGNIGKLSVCGTVNDVAMCGAEPKFLSLAAIIEEGFPMDDLKIILSSIAETAKAAGVSIVTGDTKVVEKGKADGLYINTAGIGYLRHENLSPKNLRPGDAVLLSGTAGDHGAAIMLCRNKNLLQGELKSDCTPLNGLCAALYPLGEDLRVLRDPTRGGVATTLNEFTEGSSVSIELDEKAIPVSDGVRSACDILGLDPLYCANEGKLLAVVNGSRAEEALEIMRSLPEGRNAAIIGRVSENHPGKVIVKTPFGGSRIIAKLAGDQLPRIC